ncbi:MAG: cytochrome c oxidase assembly protein [Candidatus Binataceae bacterium]
MTLESLLGPSPPQMAYSWCGHAAAGPLPGLVIDAGIVALAALYAAVALGGSRRPRRGQVAAFAAGLMLMAGVMSGPLERLALDRLFTAYIAQQIALVMLVAPLLLLGTPDWMLRPLLANRFVAPLWRRITHPFLTVLIFAAFFASIHFPAICNRVCHVHQFYYGIRLMLLVVGVLLWWPILSPLPEFPRLSYPVQILYLFSLTIPMVAISAPITFSRSILYTFYAEGAHPWGIPPLEDQALGGLLMWVGDGFYILSVITVIFFRWMAHEASDGPLASATQSQV